jgi:hypothetical protein
MLPRHEDLARDIALRKYWKAWLAANEIELAWAALIIGTVALGWFLRI